MQRRAIEKLEREGGAGGMNLLGSWGSECEEWYCYAALFVDSGESVRR